MLVSTMTVSAEYRISIERHDAVSPANCGIVIYEADLFGNQGPMILAHTGCDRVMNRDHRLLSPLHVEANPNAGAPTAAATECAVKSCGS
jgi:hypothetical protein